jgi:hypothetical protein
MGSESPEATHASPCHVVVSVCRRRGRRALEQVGISRPCVANFLGGKGLEHGVQSGIDVPRAELTIEDEQTAMYVVEGTVERFELLPCAAELHSRFGKLREELDRP